MIQITQPFPPAAGSDKHGSISIKQVLANLNGFFPMNEAVLEVLPPGVSFQAIEHYGTSAYSVTGRLVAQDAQGFQNQYFLKVSYGEQGRIMLNGEFESSKDVYTLMPDFIPQPFGFGKYKSTTIATYFYLSEFIDMDVVTAPEPEKWGQRLARLHQTSVSPTGKFGYHTTICDGKTPQIVNWEENWANFYRTLLLGVCKLDLETNGPWPALELATKRVADFVIPRLLGVLQEDGRSIKPSIIHGDLWEGNMGINKKTGDLIIFDVGCYFAHNEMELGHWRCEFSSVFRDKKYVQRYLRHFPPAEPVVEFDDRVRLYSIKGTLNYSSGHPGSSLRRTAYNDMCYLIEKYAPMEGMNNYDPNIDPDLTGSRIVPHAAEGPI